MLTHSHNMLSIRIFVARMSGLMSNTTEEQATATAQVRVGVGVMVLGPGGYVLLRRQSSHGEGEWSFPGGHLEYGESVLDCAARECEEELGVALKDAAVMPFFTEDHFPDHHKHYITLYVTGWCEEVPRIMEPHKASQIKSFNIGDILPEPLFSGVETAWLYKKNTIVSKPSK